jgi:isoquinoline 1-oxidoreductase beta subunit
MVPPGEGDQSTGARGRPRGRDFVVPRITDMPEFAVHIVPSAEPPTGMGEPGLPALAPAFANAIAQLTGKPVRQMPFNLS